MKLNMQIEVMEYIKDEFHDDLWDGVPLAIVNKLVHVTTRTVMARVRNVMNNYYGYTLP